MALDDLKGDPDEDFLGKDPSSTYGAATISLDNNVAALVSAIMWYRTQDRYPQDEKFFRQRISTSNVFPDPSNILRLTEECISYLPDVKQTISKLDQNIDDNGKLKPYWEGRRDRAQQIASKAERIIGYVQRRFKVEG